MGPDSDITANDEAIARAIATAEGESRDGVVHRSSFCPGRHGGLQLFQASNLQRVTCNGCQQRIASGATTWSCVICNYDLCERCYTRGIQPPNRMSSSYHNPTWNETASRSNYGQNTTTPNNPCSSSAIPSSHMCLLPCRFDSMTVEMLVDTGAQTSVLSISIV